MELCNKDYVFLGLPKTYTSSILANDKISDPIKQRFRDAIDGQYKYEYLIYLYPELKQVFDGINVKTFAPALKEKISTKSENLFEVVNLLRKDPHNSEEMIYWKNRVAFLEASKSNLTAIPYMAGIMADYETYGLEHLAKELDWGYATKRMDKVKSIRDIRKDAQNIVEKNKEAQYQLAYLLT